MMPTVGHLTKFLAAIIFRPHASRLHSLLLRWRDIDGHSGECQFIRLT